MSEQTQRRKPNVIPQLPFLVHLFTASGAAFALLSGLAIANGDMVAAFLWLGVALIVDGLDGPLARRLAISDRMPRWSGAILDLVIDYTTYVFLPALALIVANIVSTPFDIISAIVIAISGALYFADTRMKNKDGSFQGFPTGWNAIVFDILVLKPGGILTVIIVAILAILTFAPVRFVHPVRVAKWRLLTLSITTLWGVFAVLSLTYDLDPPMWIKAGLLLTSIYVFSVGFVHQLLDRGSSGKTS